MKHHLLFLIICLGLISLPISTIYASNQGAHVVARIEATDGTLAEGEAVGYTFREALETLAAESDITLTFAQNGASSNLVNVTGAESRPGLDWRGYIQRNGQAYKQDAYLDMTLQNGDEIVLYQGNSQETLIVTDIDCQLKDSALRFFVGVSATNWSKQQDTWLPNTYVQPVEGATVHVSYLGEEEQTITTGTDGYANLPADPRPGIVTYYADGYQGEEAPLLVRTSEQIKPIGFSSQLWVTRGEAAAFFCKLDEINNLSYSTAETGLLFADVTPSETPWAEDIKKASERGWLFGYEDGSFRPDETINLMQLCVLINRIDPNITPDTAAIDGLPLWAVNAVGGMRQLGLLEGITTGWNDPVSPDVLVQLCLKLYAL